MSSPSTTWVGALGLPSGGGTVRRAVRRLQLGDALLATLSRAAEPEIDPAWKIGIEHAELFDDRQRRLMARLHRARTDPDGRRGRRDLADQQRRGGELATPGVKWCSASQCRRYPAASTWRARSMELRNASATVPPDVIGARSSTDSGTRFVGHPALPFIGSRTGSLDDRGRGEVAAACVVVAVTEHASGLQRGHHAVDDGVEIGREPAGSEPEAVDAGVVPATQQVGQREGLVVDDLGVRAQRGAVEPRRGGTSPPPPRPDRRRGTRRGRRRSCNGGPIRATRASVSRTCSMIVATSSDVVRSDEHDVGAAGGELISRIDVGQDGDDAAGPEAVVA